MPSRRPAAGPAAPPVRAAKLADQVYERLFQEIAAGERRAGERLPPEEDLARAFGVSRPVVREALSRLRADGVVTSRQGSGSYVQRRPTRDLLTLAPLGGLADLMRCFEFRVALEGDAAALAAARRSDEDLAAIAAALDALEGAIARGELGAEADARFHATIARAARNQLFEQALEAIAAPLHAGMQVARKLSLRGSRERLALVQTEHRAILEAIARQDAEGARAAMRSHIANAKVRVLTDSVEPV